MTWGAAVGFYRAARLPEQIKGIGYMEAMVWPRNWTGIPTDQVENFKHFRKRECAKATTENNFFTRGMLFEHGILRNLSEVEKTVYPESVTRSSETSPPRIIMPNDIPFDGEPAETAALVNIYPDQLKETSTPKLFINVTGGHGLTGTTRDFACAFKNQTEVTVNARLYMQEDVPNEVRSTIADFIRSLRV